MLSEDDCKKITIEIEQCVKSAKYHLNKALEMTPDFLGVVDHTQAAHQYAVKALTLREAFDELRR